MRAVKIEMIIQLADDASADFVCQSIADQLDTDAGEYIEYYDEVELP